MPQFDKITFFNQLFWLFIFFSGFYLISLKVFLPKLSSVLKARTKKLQKGSEGLASFNDELNEVNVSFNSSIEEMSAVVKTSVSDFKEKTDTWVDSAVETINKEDLKSGNASMEKALHKQISVNHLLSNVKVSN
jgi:F0F1-type ATP synthase membrane subunit b/b'